jgi:hypothetical protein
MIGRDDFRVTRDLLDYMSFVGHRVAIDLAFVRERIAEVATGRARREAGDEIRNSIESMQRFLERRAPAARGDARSCPRV